MATLKLWYILSVLFFAYNLYQLWFDGYAVSYRINSNSSQSEHGIENSLISVCVPLSKIRNETVLDQLFEMPANGIVNVTEYAMHCVRALNEFVSTRRAGYSYSNDSIRLEGSYLFNKHFCFSINMSELNLLYSFSSFEYKMFIFSAYFQVPFGDYVYDQKRPLIKPIEFKALKGRLTFMGPPFSNCRQLGSFNTKCICLNACLRETDRKAIYMYEHDDGGLLNLNNIDRSSTDEERCYDLCKVDGCIVEHIIFINVAASAPFRPQTNLTLGGEYFDISVEPSISSFDFCLNFIGLITLLTNLSFSGSASYLADSVFNLASSRFAGENKLTAFLRRARPNMHLLILVISWAVFKELTCSMHEEHWYSQEHPTKTMVSKIEFEQEPFSVVICMPVQYILAENKPGPDEPFTLKSDQDERLLSTYSLIELVNLTDNALETALSELSIKIGSQKKPYKWRKSGQILFRKCKLPVQGRKQAEIFSRCFRREIDIAEPRYQSLLSVSTLEIELKHYFFARSIYSIYLLYENASFSSDSYFHSNRHKVNKKIRNLKNANCDDYSASKSAKEFNCRTRSDCIEKCIGRLFWKEHQNVTTNSIIDLDVIINNVGSNSSILSGLKLNDQLDRKIEQECKDKFVAQECWSKSFSESFKTLHFDPKKIKLNLYYEYILQEELASSIWKLLSNILSLASIIFSSVSVSKLIQMFFSLVKFAFRISDSKWFRPLTLVICTVGFCVHSYLIFTDITSSELIPNGYFLKNDSISIPDIVFCFKVSPKEIDPNHKLSGKYINELTDELTFDSVFDRLSYWSNGSYLDVRNFSSDASNDLERTFRFSVFFYLNMKCFDISSVLTYSEKDLFFNFDPYALKVYFKKEFFRRKTNVFYFCKNRLTMEFNEIYNLQLRESADYGHNSYKVKLELLVTEKIDKFKFFKAPLSLFYKSTNFNDPSMYIEQMKNDFFGRFNLSTNLIPLRSEDFEQELENDLFEQHYLQIQKQMDDNYPVNVDFKHQMYSNRISFQFTDWTEPEFAFALGFFVNRTLITNEDNYALLVQNLLNLLSLWTSMNVLQIPVHKLFNLFTVLYKVLATAKAALERKLMDDVARLQRA